MCGHRLCGAKPPAIARGIQKDYTVRLSLIAWLGLNLQALLEYVLRRKRDQRDQKKRSKGTKTSATGLWDQEEVRLPVQTDITHLALISLIWARRLTISIHGSNCKNDSALNCNNLFTKTSDTRSWRHGASACAHVCVIGQAEVSHCSRWLQGS